MKYDATVKERKKNNKKFIFLDFMYLMIFTYFNLTYFLRVAKFRIKYMSFSV